MDFQERLADYIDTLKTGIPLYNDTNIENESFSLYSLPGSTVVKRYMDGIEDKKINYELLLKAKVQNREKAVNVFSKIVEKLQTLTKLNSNDGSFEFQEITFSSETYFDEATTDGFVYFRATFSVLLTIINL